MTNPQVAIVWPDVERWMMGRGNSQVRHLGGRRTDYNYHLTQSNQYVGRCGVFLSTTRDAREDIRKCMNCLKSQAGDS